MGKICQSVYITTIPYMQEWEVCCDDKKKTRNIWPISYYVIYCNVCICCVSGVGFTSRTQLNNCEGKVCLKMCHYWCFISVYHEVTAQEGLEEAALAAANVSKDITAEDAALGLLLLQVNLLISGHCRGQTTHGCQRIRLLLYTTHACSQSATTIRLSCCITADVWQSWLTDVITDGLTVA